MAVSLDVFENDILPFVLYSKDREEIIESFPVFCQEMTDIDMDNFRAMRYPGRDVLELPFYPNDAWCGLSLYYFWMQGTVYRLYWEREYRFQEIKKDGDALVMTDMPIPQWLGVLVKTYRFRK